MNIDEKAHHAARLLRDEAFTLAIQEIRESATRVFLDAGSTPAAREQAHEDVRAIATFHNRLTLWGDSKKIADKRKSAP